MNKYDKKAISEILIAMAGLGSIQDTIRDFPPCGSQYKTSSLERIKSESIEKLEQLKKKRDKFITGIGQKNMVSIINRSKNHIDKADEMVGSELNQVAKDQGNVCEKKILSGLSICQAGLINADKIFSNSLAHSKNKDMQTSDTIHETLDLIEEILDWIDEKYNYLANYMTKEEMDLTMKRANNYLILTDQEVGLL